MKKVYLVLGGQQQDVKGRCETDRGFGGCWSAPALVPGQPLLAGHRETCCPVTHPNTWKRQHETWGKSYFLVTEIVLPLSSKAELLPCNYSWSGALDSRYMQTRLHAIRYFNEEVSVFCVEGFGICMLTGVACVRRTCELMTLFITHLIITHSLMPQTATNSLNQFLLLEIKLRCFSCDLLEECCCCYLFF